MSTNLSRTTDIPTSAMRHFDESIRLDDPHPGKGWLPSPEQIARWAAVIRDEREDVKLDAHQTDTRI